MKTAKQKSNESDVVSFGPGLFEFLTELRSNNERAWFEANKRRYESEVKEPVLHFITRFGPHLAEISPQFVADPRPVGGSMFRIYRDTRFSKDKSPYKTNIGAQFRHHAGKDVHAPGFYLHLEPGNSFGGGGIWHPDGSALAKIREWIVSEPEDWQAVLDTGIEIVGDSLRRVPAGFDAGHPYVDDLKRKDFYTITRFSDAEVWSAGFIERYQEACRRAAPLARSLTRALQLEW